MIIKNVTNNENKKTMMSLVTGLVAMVMTLGVNFFLSPYIVEHFGEEANGFTQLANNFVNYATLITLALNSMAGRFITIAHQKKDYEMCNKYYSSVFLGNIFIIAALILPAVFIVSKLEGLINIDTANVFHVKILFALVFANFFVSQINSIFAIVFYAKNAQYIQNIINMLKTLLNACGLFFAFALFSPRIYYVSLVVLVLSVMILPVFIATKKMMMPEITISVKYLDFKIIKELVSAGAWNVVNQCGNILMTGFDLLLTNLFINPIQMGILSVAKTIPTGILQLVGTINITFSPNLTIAYTKEDKKHVVSALRYSMKCSSILLAIPISVICVYGMSFYSLWVPSMEAKQLTILSVLSIAAYIPFAGPQVLYNVYTTANKLKLNSVTVLIGGALNAIIVYILLKNTDLGVFAVAGVSSIISTIRNLMVTVPYTAKILGLKWYTFYKDVLLSCCSVGIGVLVCMGFVALIKPTSWVKLVISICMACVISLFFLILLLLKKSEKKQLLKNFLRGKYNG